VRGEADAVAGSVAEVGAVAGARSPPAAASTARPLGPCARAQRLVEHLDRCRLRLGYELVDLEIAGIGSPTKSVRVMSLR